jgi:LysM repeat protein
MNNLKEQGGIHVGEELKLPAAAVPADDQPDTPKPVALKDSGATYTVVHGDTPVGIAHKLHVGYDDLIRLNKIEDPKKLRIGMKLKVPAKHPEA